MDFSRTNHINLISSSDRITGLVDEGEADVMYPDCKKTVYAVLHHRSQEQIGGI